MPMKASIQKALTKTELKSWIKIRFIKICLFFSVLTFFLGCNQNSNKSVTPPYPKSEVVKSVYFQKVSEIVRYAEGSDNWPMTWADDGLLYTSYGDGNGFQPKVNRKLSLGLSKIDGYPPDIVGENIRSESAESYGNGKKGLKASGMLMIDGRLYMLVRNVDGKGRYAMLMWSDNHGSTWKKGFKLYKDFGCPTFLNYGKNYSGNKDNFVYIYSQRGPSAYKSYDGIVLARVPKTDILNESAYEYFSGYEKKIHATWSKDPKKMKSIFNFPDHCQRMDVVYHPGLDRYLLVLAYNGESGWGLYESKNQWGKWNTIFHTDNWDVPGVHGFRIPTKWIDKDDKTIHLVFSGSYKDGYDAFCIRKLIFH